MWTILVWPKQTSKGLGSSGLHRHEQIVETPSLCFYCFKTSDFGHMHHSKLFAINLNYIQLEVIGLLEVIHSYGISLHVPKCMDLISNWYFCNISVPFKRPPCILHSLKQRPHCSWGQSLKTNIISWELGIVGTHFARPQRPVYPGPLRWANRLHRFLFRKYVMWCSVSVMHDGTAHY